MDPPAERLRRLCLEEMEALGAGDPGRLAVLLEEKRTLLAALEGSPRQLRAARDANRQLLAVLRRGLRELEGVYRR